MNKQTNKQKNAANKHNTQEGQQILGMDRNSQKAMVEADTR